MKRKAKKGNPVVGCLALVVVIGAIASQFPRANKTQPSAPDTQIVQALGPAGEKPVLLPTTTDEPLSTDTPIPLLTDTPVPLPTNLPTVAPVQNSGGSDQPFACNGGCMEPLAGSTCKIKGNVNSKGDKIFHMPGWRDYDRTNVKPEEGDRWFCTEDEARAAGFRAPLNQ